MRVLKHFLCVGLVAGVLVAMANAQEVEEQVMSTEEYHRITFSLFQEIKDLKKQAYRTQVKDGAYYAAIRDWIERVKAHDQVKCDSNLPILKITNGGFLVHRDLFQLAKDSSSLWTEALFYKFDLAKIFFENPELLEKEVESWGW